MLRGAAVVIGTLFLNSCSCGGDDGKPIVALALDKSTLALAPFESSAVHATATYDDGTSADVTGEVEWRSSDDAIATVASTGVVTGISVGMARITATIEGQSAQLEVGVLDRRIVSLAVDPSTEQLVAGKTRALFALATASDGAVTDVASEAVWTSSDETVATVAAGVVTARAVGHAVIRAKFGGLTARSRLQVSLNQARTSPLNGEVDVAVSRETVLRFLAPLAASVRPTLDHVHADFGGQRIPARLHLSADRKTLTMFYDEFLPASTRVVVTIVGDALLDEQQRALDADGDGVAGGTTQLAFDTLSLSPLEGTAVIGRVFASELAAAPGGGTMNVPLAGVTITVEGIAAAELSAVTDAMGNFRLEPAPVGRFFALIEGRSAVASPTGAYYPHVSKAWVGVPEAVTSVGEIYLPRIPPGTLKLTSATAETLVELPADVLAARPDLRGVSVRVPAGALFADDGTIGGAVGIAPVPPDRLPSPLPPGLPFPLVITVQTDGALNFDAPVPVCFPNLPDPVTSSTARPGARSGLYSFNHDTGEFEAVGPMVVSADGRLVCSADGTGILAPGWHGVSPNNEVKPEPAPPPPPPPPPRGGGGGMMMCPDIATAEFWDFAKALFDCVKLLIKADTVLEAVSKIVEQVIKIGTEVTAVARAYETGNMPLVAVRAALSTAIITKDLLKVEFETFLGAVSPVQKISDALTCASQALAVIATPCQAVAACEDRYSFLVQVTCDLVLRASERLNQVAQIFATIHTLITAAPFVEPCRLLDEAKAAVDAQIALERMQAMQPGALRAAAVDPVVLAKLRATSESLGFFNDISLDTIDSGLALLDDIQLNAGRAHQQYRGPSRNAYVMFEQNGVKQRSVADAAGHFRGFVPPATKGLVSIVDRPTLRCGTLTFASGQPGRSIALPAVPLGVCSGADGDGDELTDEAEDIIGTSPTNPDTDNDGTLDGAEVRAETDPLDGIIAQTGIVSMVTSGLIATDVCSSGGLIGVANADSFFSVFNAFQGMAPILVARAPAFTSYDIACGPTTVAVLDAFGSHPGISGMTTGITVMELDPRSPTPAVRDLTIPGLTGGIAIFGTEAFVGHQGGVWAIDLLTGAITADAPLGDTIDDLAVSGGLLYAIGDRFHTIDPVSLLPIHDLVVPVTGLPERGRSLFVGSREAFAVHATGLMSIDLGNPLVPSVLGLSVTTARGWRDVAANGSGLAIAVSGPNPGDRTPHDLEIYNVADRSQLERFVNRIPMPGHAWAVSIERGLAYAAFGQREMGFAGGLAVASYTSADVMGRPPTVSLAAAPPGNMTARATFTLTASVGDDVEVRNVEFYENDRLVFSDGSYPFEVLVIGPDVMATYRARAFDTGGNATWSAPLVIRVAPDTFRPTVLGVTMRPAAPRAIRATFSEAIDPSTVKDATFAVIEAGTDGMLDTVDDQPIRGTIRFAAEDRVAQMVFDVDLAPGLYRVTMGADIADRAGNTLGAPYVQTLCRTASCDSAPVRLCSTTAGRPPATPCMLSGVSHDGSVVSFDSSAPDLVVGDGNAQADVFVVSYPALVTERVSLSSAGAEANAASNFSTLSRDGRFVAFSSGAANLDPSAPGGVPRVFVRDRTASSLHHVSVTSAGEASDNRAGPSSIGADGRFVAFVSSSTNLDPRDTDPGDDVFLHDRQSGATEIVSLADDESLIADVKRDPQVSTDGNRIVFRTSIVRRIYLRDRAAGTTRLVDVDPLGARVLSVEHQMTANGRFIIYGDGNTVYLLDVDTGDVTLEVAEQNLAYPSISEDGTRLVYRVGNDIKLLNLTTDVTTILFTAPGIRRSMITGDGSAVIFEANINNTAVAFYPYRLAIP